MRCIACELFDVAQPWATEVHHIVDRGTRKHSGGHDATLPLCAWHHRGVCKDCCTSSDMAVLFGPSLALEKRQFCIVFWPERELLVRVNLRLQVAA